jgi:hypothetical protein
MSMMPRSRRPARLPGCTVLTLGLAGLAAPAQARGSVTLVVSHVVASCGDNSFGELGDGVTSRPAATWCRSRPGGPITLALRSDGTVWAWGVNDLGQLNLAPSRPVNEIAAGTRITQISAGFAHMLALRSDGTVLGLAGQSS